MKKLVRDKIPSIMEAKQAEFEIQTVSGDVKLQYLIKKLSEESFELDEAIMARTHREIVEEFADVLEVLDALQAELGLTDTELAEAKDHKRARRGGFDKGYVLSVDK